MRGEESSKGEPRRSGHIETFDFHGSHIRITEPDAIVRAVAAGRTIARIDNTLPSPIEQLVTVVGRPEHHEEGIRLMGAIMLSEANMYGDITVAQRFNEALTEKLQASRFTADLEISHLADSGVGGARIRHRETGIQAMTGGRYVAGQPYTLVLNFDPDDSSEVFPCDQPPAAQLQVFMGITAAVAEASYNMGNTFGVHADTAEGYALAAQTALEAIRAAGHTNDTPLHHTYELSPEQHEPPIPLDTEAAIGLMKTAENRLIFKMPKPKSITHTLDFVMSTVTHLLQAADVKTGVVFIAAKAAAGYGISVAADKLLDTALTDMLYTTGEVDYAGAARAFGHAKDASTAAEQAHHREDARQFLLRAYESYEAAIGALEGKVTSESPELHAKAAVAAIVLSSLEHSLGHQVAGDWAAKALSHNLAHQNAALDRLTQAYETLLQRYQLTARGGAATGAHMAGPPGSLIGGLIGMGLASLRYDRKIDDLVKQVTVTRQRFVQETQQLHKSLAGLMFTSP